MEGLLVTISPTQSAFFAGEQFSATITFTNSFQPSTSTSSNSIPTSNSIYTKSRRSIPQSSTAINSSEWSKAQDESLNLQHQQQQQINRQSSITSISSNSSNLPEYSTSYLNSEDFPPSPFFSDNKSSNMVSNSTTNSNLSLPSTSTSTSNRRESIISTTSGGALKTPHSATSFNQEQQQSQSHQSNLRSASTNTLSISTNLTSTSNQTTPMLPTRKGLIGKPIRTSISNSGINGNSGGGLYGGLRRPGGVTNNHGRAQSMAVSSPDLLSSLSNGNSNLGGSLSNSTSRPPISTSSSFKGHSKGRLGGSLGGEALAGLMEDPSRTGISRLSTPSIVEEPPSPGLFDSSPLPSFAATSSISPPILSFSSPPTRSISSPVQSPYSQSLPPQSQPQQQQPLNRNRSYSSSNSMNSLENNSHPSDSSLVLHDLDENDIEDKISSSFYGLRNDTMESLVRDNLDEQTGKGNDQNDSTSTIAHYYEEEEEDEYQNPNNVKLPPSSIINDPYRPSTLPPPHSAPPLSKSTNSRYAPTSSSSSSFLHPPNTLTLLWSFAHLEGTFETEPNLIKSTEFIQLKSSLLSPFVPGSGLGGGTLPDEEAILKSNGGGSWRDWIWGGGNNSPSLGSSQGNNLSGTSMSTPVMMSAASLEERKKEKMKEKSVPTFSCPPSILGVDLVLKPGESKTYTFSIRIPADLPPSFRGKSIKFSYHLVVGTNRASLGGKLRGPARDSLSRVMRVPIRVYNHVAVTGARPFYDLTNPIVYHRDEATTTGVDISKLALIASTTKRATKNDTGRKDFETYATTLLDSILLHPLPPNTPGAGYIPSEVEEEGRLTPIIMESTPDLRPEMRSRSGIEGGSLNLKNKTSSSGPAFGVEEEGEGCKGAVEIVSRNSQKVSYDINKDGFMVASLTLVKSAYRLGETVNGSVILNSGDGRVLRVSARLETHELIETSISTKSAPQIRQITRRLHSEYHETTLDSARVGFALAIPSGATPDFATSGVKLQWSVRLSFLVIPPSPDSPLPPPPKKPRNPSTVGIPAPIPPTPLRHGRSKSFAYGFEPSVPLTLPAAPSILPTGATHLMPVLSELDLSTSHTSYRAVPDLGFVPVIFTSKDNTTTSSSPLPGPLQRSVSGGNLNSHKISPSLASMRGFSAPVQQLNSVVLVPAKIETVECSIPIKVYPGNTPFRPTIFRINA